MVAVNVSNAQEMAKPTWPVTVGEPGPVALAQSAPIRELLWRWVIGDTRQDITLYEYEDPSRLGPKEVISTGNSITFDLEGIRLPSSLIYGGGDKWTLYVSLYKKRDSVDHVSPFKNGKTFKEKQIDSLKNNKIEIHVELHSAPRTDIGERRNFFYWLNHRKQAEIYTARAGEPMSSVASELPKKGPIVYSSEKFCGFEMFRDPEKYARLNSIAIGSLAPPFNKWNIFCKIFWR